MEQTTGFPVEYVVAIVAAVVLLALVLIVIKLLKKPLAQRKHDDAELQLKQQVAEKAARSADNAGIEQAENLTDSGVFSVLEMMDALVSGGNYDEAEKWALKAIQNHPNRADVPVKLAEIYYQAGRKSAFLAIVRNLSDNGMDMPPSAWEKLARMAADLAPGEPLLEALEQRAKAPAAATVH